MQTAESPITDRQRVPEDLLRTAERLFAINGIEGVSLRQIAAEAGYRNPATVQYHVGSRIGLLRAIIGFRLPPINRRRLQLIEQLHEEGRDFQLRGLVEALARPLLELDPESRYVEFLARLLNRSETEEVYLSNRALLRGIELIQEQLAVALDFLPPNVRRGRFRMAGLLLLSSIATQRARADTGLPLELRGESFVQNLFDTMVGLLGAEHTPLRTPSTLHNPL